MRNGIYLDYHATTPVDPEALTAMLPYFTEKFGNAMSGSHPWGWEAKAGVERARKSVARLLGAEDREIIFTSGATESIHLAILGVLRERDKPGHLITAATEHKAVFEICTLAKAEGHKVTVLDVDKFGRVSLDDIEKALSKDTALVSLMHGNNEIGTLLDVQAVGEITRRHNILFHLDAAQTAGKHPLDVRSMHIDLLSLSAHKLYGPKGVGALFVRQTSPRVHIKPYVAGGGQEHGLRGGTHNVPAIVGFGAACDVALAKMAEESSRLTALRDHMIKRLTTEIDGVVLNGHPTQRLCNNVNVTVSGVPSDRILLTLHDVAFSSGSACSSNSSEVSHVLRAIGGTNEKISTTMRFGLGRPTTQNEVDEVIDRLIAGIQRIRSSQNP